MTELRRRNVKILVHKIWTVDGDETSAVDNPTAPEALMAFAEQVRGNAGARVSVTTDFGMKDYGNGASGSVTISLDCNEDDNTVQAVARGLSSWTIGLAEEHFQKADEKYRQLYFQKHPEQAPVQSQQPFLPPPAPFKP